MAASPGRGRLRVELRISRLMSLTPTVALAQLVCLCVCLPVRSSTGWYLSLTQCVSVP